MCEILHERGSMMIMIIDDLSKSWFESDKSHGPLLWR